MLPAKLTDIQKKKEKKERLNIHSLVLVIPVAGPFLATDDKKKWTHFFPNSIRKTVKRKPLKRPLCIV